MKNKIYSIVLAMAVAMGLASCDDWSPALEKEGTVQLSSMAVSVTDHSRAAVDVSDFTVKIMNGETQVKEWTYSEMPETFTLAEGNDYSVVAYSHKVQPAEWDKPYYKGTKTFKIEANRITNIGTVECTLASIKVTVKFDEDLKKMMGENCKVVVVATDGADLEFTKDETRAGYFEYVDNSTTLVATLTGTINGEEVEITQPFSDVTAGKYYNLTFGLNNDYPTPSGFGGEATLKDGLTLTLTVSEKDMDGNVTIKEDVITPGDRPDKEEEKKPDTPDDPTPDNPDTPDDPNTEEALKFETDLSWDTANAVEDGKTYKVDIHSEKGLAHLNVKIESTNGKFIASVGDLMPTEFDLAYPGEYGESLESIGLKTGSDVIGQNDVPFDISDLVPLLGGFEGTHKFTITVSDNDGNTLSKTLTFDVIKDE